SLNNSNLEWLVKELGSDCLTVPDSRGDTAVHLAAQWQPVDSLQFIFDQIGAENARLEEPTRAKTPADYVESYCYFRDLSKAGPGFLHAAAARSLLGLPLASFSGRLPPQLALQLRVPAHELDRASSRLGRLRSDCLKRLAKGTWLFTAAEDAHDKRVVTQKGGGRQKGGDAEGVTAEGAKKQLDPSFTDWDFILQDDKKQLIGRGGFGKRAVEMEKRGVEILKRLSHPNILQFLKCEQKSDGLYIFTELVSGVIKLIDFGLAKEIEKTCGLSTGFGPKGTMYFMAPELFDTKLKSLLYSAKTDVWAFGCTVYELTAMQPPDGDQPIENIGILRFRKQKMPRIADGFSAGLKDFYLRCVDYDPRKRADTAELLRQQLPECLILTARAMGCEERAALWSGRFLLGDVFCFI
uniref:Protein kinase domain-containing protein n=1 Tax=Macrostomum lignano TaxID=282301 RepID=A0A1I8JQJ0_9PLAT